MEAVVAFDSGQTGSEDGVATAVQPVGLSSGLCGVVGRCRASVAMASILRQAS